jgi:hypothetical protein
MVNRVVDAALQIHGGMEYMKELPIERIYRMCAYSEFSKGPPKYSGWSLQGVAKGLILLSLSESPEQAHYSCRGVEGLTGPSHDPNSFDSSRKGRDSLGRI